MSNEFYKNVLDAKKSIKAHIKFLDYLLSHLNSNDEVLKNRAMWASWCLHRYFQYGLVEDIQNAMKQYGDKADGISTE